MYFKAKINHSAFFLSLQVTANGLEAQGTGPNKKLAKRAAAEALLQEMGYSRPSLQPAKPALKSSSSTSSTTSSSSSSNASPSQQQPPLANGEVKSGLEGGKKKVGVISQLYS